VEPLPSVVLQCDGRMVGQALANILKNAGEAVGAKRARDPVAEEALGIIARLDIEDERAVFTIEDDGVGLPAKDRDRLTEPYVTTRE
ncbi:ATP-binding protein, partial [Klebsiella pneumoniae]|nr:PAS domain-containing sensor histidine kinase [Klebsiella pneumoniae]